MYKCDNCQKGLMLAKSGAHRHGGKWAMRATKKTRVWKPNLHSVKIEINGASKKMRLCTKCLRLLKKKPEDKVSSKEETSKETAQTQAL